MILLIYFNRILGPRIFLTEPSQLAENMEQFHLEQIKSLLDTNEEGFFAHNFSPEFKTANYIFTLESEYARGGSELVMLTIVVSEEEPDYNFYESVLKKYTEKIKEIDEIFKIFYEARDLDDEKQMESLIKKITHHLKNLSRIIAIKSIETEGKLITFDKFQTMKSVSLSDRFVKNMETLRGKNLFIVSRNRDETIKIDMIPVNADKVIRLSVIFNEKTTIMVVQEVSKILSKFENQISLVFTSGVCQEQDRCVYEVYITSKKNDLDSIIQNIQQIPGVISVEVKYLELEAN